MTSRKRRGGRPSTYELRRLDIGRLFYAMTDDERDVRRPNDGDVAARAVMADALHERGMQRLAVQLLRWPRDKKLGGTIFHQKIRRAIFGPEKREFYGPRKPPSHVVLAQLGPQLGSRWFRMDAWKVEDSDGVPWVIEVSMGFHSWFMLVVARDQDAALEIAEEKWPDLLFDEVDDDDLRTDEDGYDIDEYGRELFDHPTKRGVMVRRSENVGLHRARNVSWARVVDADRRQAYVPEVGIVEYML